MSPSTPGLGVLLEALDLDVNISVQRGQGDRWSTGPRGTPGGQGAGGERDLRAGIKSLQGEGNWRCIYSMSNNNLKILTDFLQCDSQLINSVVNVDGDTRGAASGDAVMGSTGSGGGSVARVVCWECPGETWTKAAAPAPRPPLPPSPRNVKIPIIESSVAPLVASKFAPKPFTSRSKQDQRARPSAALSVTPRCGQRRDSLGLSASPAAGRGAFLPEGRLNKNPSGNITVNTFPETTTPPRVHVSPPAGRPAAAPAPGGGSRMLPRLWELTLLLLTLLLAAPVSGRYDRGGPQHSITWGRGNSHSSAVFGNPPANITAVLGHRARLPCQVKNLGHKDVSWIRQRDLHILTVGIFTYTSDDRFKVFHPPETEDFFLDISSVTYRDSGVYECQVSTSPKVSLPIHLTVLAVQEAEIPGPREVFIQHGSTISLQCEVRAGVEAVGLVRWYQGAAPLNYSSPRGGISMEVEKTPTMTTSKLYITRAVKADSGNYTCAPNFARPDSVIVHVVNAGEESAAAVQSGVVGVRAGVGLLWAALLLIAALHPPPPAPRLP